MDKSSLGDRMKKYEKQYTGQQLFPLNPICARMDGRSFHMWTKGLHRPYDERLSQLMVETTKFLVGETNANCGYTQSDEISLIWVTDRTDQTIFFDGKLLKMASILSSLTSVYFNKNLEKYIPEKADTFPHFDSRVWSVPTDWEASNYLLWRELDATRNSLSMAAQSVYSHKELHKKNSSDKHEMLHKKGEEQLP